MRPPNRPPTPPSLETAPRSHRSRRSRRHSHSSGPIFSIVYFCLLALHWILVGAAGIYYLRPRPYTVADVLVGALCVAMALFYFWVAYAVYCRRSYIFNIAVTCAGIWLLGFPTGTFVSFLLIGNLLSARHTFTR